MTSEEINIRCLEFAMAQARLEGRHADRGAVAELQTWFRNLIVYNSSSVVNANVNTTDKPLVKKRGRPFKN